MPSRPDARRPGACVFALFPRRPGALALLAAAALVVCGCAEQDRRDAIAALFLPHLDGYTAVTERDIVERPYVRGKVVVYVPGERELDQVYYSLPEELRAANPEEVGTVVRVGCAENVVGHYTDGSEAFQTACSLLLIDWGLPAIIGQQTFEGAEPPSAKALPGSRHGYGRPDSEIAGWLASLPRIELGAEGQPTGTPGATEPAAAADTAAPKPANTPTAAPGSPGVDYVVALNPGRGANPEYGLWTALIGDADLIEKPCCRGMLQLGRGGSVLVAFIDNSIVDGSGPDLQVYGESAKDDFLLVEVSEDGRVWRSFPTAAESSGPLDLADVGLARAMLVRLTDVQPGTSTGAEVDAVVALHSGPPFADLPALPDATVRAQITLGDAPGSSANTGGSVAAGTDLAVVRRSRSGEWVEVRAPTGKTGWCRTTALALNVSLSDYAAVE